MRELPPYRIVGRVIRLGVIESTATTAWPWPFCGDNERDPAWLARYEPHRLTPADVMDLAGIANAYETLITHPSRSLRENVFTLHRIFRKEHP